MAGKVGTPSLLAWAVAVAIAVTIMRNPLYLVLIFFSCLAVALSLRLPTSDLKWLAVGWLGLGGISAIFNFLTVRAGDFVLVELPRDIPLWGGVYTLNALVYGLQLAQVFSTLSLAFWVFWRAARTIDIYRMVPRRLHALGVALTLGLTLFPGLVQAVIQVRDAQRIRLADVSRLKRYAVLVIPSVGITLDRSLQLAEAMESRGFGASRQEAPWTPLAMALGISLSLVAIYVSLSGGRVWGYALLAGGLSVLLSGLLTVGDLQRAFKGLRASRPRDVVMLASAVLTAGGVLGAALAGASSLYYYPYPKLALPSFEMWAGMAALSPAMPAFYGLLERDPIDRRDLPVPKQ